METWQNAMDRHRAKTTSITGAVCDAAVAVAEEVDAPMILVGTRSGRTALNISNR